MSSISAAGNHIYKPKNTTTPSQACFFGCIQIIAGGGLIAAATSRQCSEQDQDLFFGIGSVFLVTGIMTSYCSMKKAKQAAEARFHVQQSAPLVHTTQRTEYV